MEKMRAPLHSARHSHASTSGAGLSRWKAGLPGMNTRSPAAGSMSGSSLASSGPWSVSASGAGEQKRGS
jgi:hypothetical protein